MHTQDEITLTLRRHIATRLPSATAAWERLPEGSINDSWKVTSTTGEVVIVRIGPSAETVEGGPSWLRANALGCEQRFLHLVRPHIPQVPATVAAGFLPFGRPWVVQECVSGSPLALALPSLSDDGRRQIWRQVGMLLRRLQRIPGPWFGTPDGRDVFPAWYRMVLHDVDGLLSDAGHMRLPLEPFSALRDLALHHEAELSAVSPPRIVHSDLDARHIFVQPDEGEWTITGVIDWEYGRYADPESEGLLIDMIDRPEDDPDRRAFLAGYGAFDRSPAGTLRRKIYRGIGLGWGLTDAVRRGDARRRESALATLQLWAKDHG